MPEPIPAPARRLLDEPTYPHVVTLMPDGMPQTTPVWIARDGDIAVFNTAKGRVKYRNLTRDNRCALSVHDPENAYSYLQIRGHVEFVEEGARAQIDELSRKYLGKDYPFERPGEVRVICRLIPDHVQYNG